MSSGPSVILVITKGETGDTIIEEWRELIGPKAVEEAKEKAPDRYDVSDVLTLVVINYIPRIRRIGGCYGFTSKPPTTRRPQWC